MSTVSRPLLAHPDLALTYDYLAEGVQYDPASDVMSRPLVRQSRFVSFSFVLLSNRTWLCRAQLLVSLVERYAPLGPARILAARDHRSDFDLIAVVQHFIFGDKIVEFDDL